MLQFWMLVYLALGALHLLLGSEMVWHELFSAAGVFWELLVMLLTGALVAGFGLWLVVWSIRAFCDALVLWKGVPMSLRRYQLATHICLMAACLTILLCAVRAVQQRIWLRSADQAEPYALGITIGLIAAGFSLWTNHVLGRAHALHDEPDGAPIS